MTEKGTASLPSNHSGRAFPRKCLCEGDSSTFKLSGGVPFCGRKHVLHVAQPSLLPFSRTFSLSKRLYPLTACSVFPAEMNYILSSDYELSYFHYLGWVALEDNQPLYLFFRKFFKMVKHFGFFPFVSLCLSICRILPSAAI